MQSFNQVVPPPRLCRRALLSSLSQVHPVLRPSARPIARIPTELRTLRNGYDQRAAGHDTIDDKVAVARGRHIAVGLLHRY